MPVTLNLRLPGDAAEQDPDMVPGLRLVYEFAKRFNSAHLALT